MASPPNSQVGCTCLRTGQTFPIQSCIPLSGPVSGDVAPSLLCLTAGNGDTKASPSWVTNAMPCRLRAIWEMLSERLMSQQQRLSCGSDTRQMCTCNSTPKTPDARHLGAWCRYGCFHRQQVTRAASFHSPQTMVDPALCSLRYINFYTCIPAEECSLLRNASNLPSPRGWAAQWPALCHPSHTVHPCPGCGQGVHQWLPPELCPVVWNTKDCCHYATGHVDGLSWAKDSLPEPSTADFELTQLSEAPKRIEFDAQQLPGDRCYYPSCYSHQDNFMHYIYVRCISSILHIRTFCHIML